MFRGASEFNEKTVQVSKFKCWSFTDKFNFVQSRDKVVSYGAKLVLNLRTKSRDKSGSEEK